MTKTKKKSFDAVEFMRKQRERLSKLYSENPEKFFQEVKEAGEKYRESSAKKSHKQKSKV
ncbi:hypothetical protein ASZ90_005167 [hydrocarbon metagenome]|uniref:Uncharacterized protein n=1 Tax=hydrocarbon metagenome TaxID=938273 RepID=A0A0W8FVT6_9ZZZZ